MQVHDLPILPHLHQHKSSPVDESWPVIQVKCNDRGFSCHLYLHSTGLNIHKWRFLTTSANLLKNFAESSFELSAPLRPFGNCPRIEHRRIIGKKRAEMVPLKIVKRLDKRGQGRLHLGVILSGWG